jgi:hypothetical protein
MVTFAPRRKRNHSAARHLKSKHQVKGTKPLLRRGRFLGAGQRPTN